jgi:hypothetical protein
MPGNTYSILGLLHLIVWLIAAVEILRSGASVGKKVVWLLVIFLLPVVGLILYFLVGRK